MAKGGGQPKTPQSSKKLAKPPLSGDAGPFHRRAKRSDKFLGFFLEFSDKFRKFSVVLP